MIKLKIFEKFDFCRNFLQKIIKSRKKALFLPKKLLAVTRRAGLHNLSSRVIRCSSNFKNTGLQHIDTIKAEIVNFQRGSCIQFSI